MTVIAAGDRRTTVTPNATMTTCCTPAQGEASMALWLTAMAPGAQGPWHRLDGEQVLTVLSGGLVLELAGSSVLLGPGDTAVLPGGEQRRIAADARLGVEMVCAAARPLRASVDDGVDRGVPDWMR